MNTRSKISTPVRDHMPTSGRTLGFGLPAAAGQAQNLQRHAAARNDSVRLPDPAPDEPRVRHGPFALNNREQINDRIRACQRGEFGPSNDDWRHNGHEPS